MAWHDLELIEAGRRIRSRAYTREIFNLTLPSGFQ